jgi:GTP-dependent phosphoenolpyruvate carboxykinase
MSKEDLQTLLSVDPESGGKELEDAKTYFARLGDKLPAAMQEQLEQLGSRLEALRVAA